MENQSEQQAGEEMRKKKGARRKDRWANTVFFKPHSLSHDIQSNQIHCVLAMETMTMVHLTHEDAKRVAEAALCSLLADGFPDQPAPDELTDALGFYSEDLCHWILLQDLQEEVSCEHGAGVLRPENLFGCVCCVHLSEAVFVHALTVRPVWQGKGYATSLMLEAERFAMGLGVNRLEGTVQVEGRSSARLCGFYQKLGGELVEGAGFGPGSEDATQLRFRKCLTTADPTSSG